MFSAEGYIIIFALYFIENMHYIKKYFMLNVVLNGNYVHCHVLRVFLRKTDEV